MPTKMLAEIEEAPEAIRRLLTQSGPSLHAAGMRLRELDPPVIVTVARGSSDHAATYVKYAVELMTGRPVASLGPSVVSVYGARLRLAGAAALAISQSGRSPDIVALLTAARDGGAETIALVNAEGSPLSAVAHYPIALAAGPERSVAATKSVVASVVAGLSLLAAWADDAALSAALDALPEQIAAALALDWSAAAGPAAAATSLFTLGRGPGFAVASEAALKFKETSQIHAEAYSGAEVLHGPLALVGSGFPVFAFLPDDAARPSLTEALRTIDAAGAHLFVAGEASVGTRLPTVATGHMLTEPLVMLVAFYRFVEAVARARDLDPDAPRGLKKVTETL